jgi:superfamily I DNA/RNA helicase
MAGTQIERAAEEAALRAVRDHPAFGQTVLARLPEAALRDFVVDEVAFVRMRFLPFGYEKYATVARHGRGIPLPEKARLVILAGVQAWDKELNQHRVKDHEGIVQTALSLLTSSALTARQTFCYRCVLVDEVQDLTQLEMRILSRIPDKDGKPVAELPNGLFLVGDGAQTIYKRGFSLKQCGISLGNRSFVLKKNYRNTREILQAAYGLIEEYEFADVDEENIQKPTPPDLSSRHGEKPLVVKCLSYNDECEFVVGRIREIIDEQRLRDETAELEVATEIPICVIGFTKVDRERIGTALHSSRVPTTELREDVAWESNAVKISTLESAKGHELHAVFIVGLCQGNMPSYRVEESDWKRGAARLYVAMTRARDRLYLSYNIRGRNGPSVFLSAIQDNCEECVFRHGRLTFER